MVIYVSILMILLEALRIASTTNDGFLDIHKLQIS